MKDDWCKQQHHLHAVPGVAMTKGECERLMWALGFNLRVVREEHMLQDATVRAVPDPLVFA